MLRRTLGSGQHALEVSAQGFGCMGITAFYGKPMKDDDAIELLKRVFEKGVTHWDTAEIYTGKDANGKTVYNETVVGKAIASIGKRHEIEIATKYMPSKHDKNEMTVEMVLKACRESCDRLGVEYVDLYYVHRLHPRVPVEQQARAMKAVLDAGLAKRVGVSEFSPKSLATFHAICPVTCIQQEWSLMNRDLEADLVPLCRQLGIGIVAYSPLCRKLLSGDLRTTDDLNEGDMRSSRYGRLTHENLAHNARLVENVSKIAQDRGLTTAQLSLTWVASQGDDVCPIPGTTKIPHLEDNVKAMLGPQLTPDECKVVASAIPIDKIKGNRFNDKNNPDSGTYKANL